jgi:hypothetical protein
MSDLHFLWKPAIFYFFFLLGLLDFIESLFNLIKEIIKNRRK